jgi:hypothetical protein
MREGLIEMMDNAKIEEQYKLYKQRQEEKAKEEQKEKEATLKRRAELKERLEKIQKACEPHPATVTKAHKCTSCHAIIPKGSRVIVEGQTRQVHVMYNYGSTLTEFRTIYFCNACRPVTEA